MITNEQTSENGRVAIEVTVEPSEVKAWALESGFVEEGTDWGDDGTQRKLKSAIAARVEHALLNDRRPSPVTHPVIVSKDEGGRRRAVLARGVVFLLPVGRAFLLRAHRDSLEASCRKR